MVGWRAIYLLAGCLTVLSPTANAQGVRAVRTIPGGVGGGVGVQSVQEFDGSGPHRGFMVAIGGPGGPIDIGGSLLKVCDANQDGLATADETKNGLATWFQKADTDTNGALSEVEVEAALQLTFPTPQPPPGFPPMPEEFALPKPLAKKLMASVDANQDAWITLKEATAFVDQSFAQWDLDGSGSLDASEFAAAFAQFMPPPGGGVIGGGSGTFHFRARPEGR
jgi:hypothetical protein